MFLAERIALISLVEQLIPGKSTRSEFAAYFLVPLDGGSAMAELLFGKANPSGRLPISWESSLANNPSIENYYPAPASSDILYREGVFVGYRGYDHLHRKPLFPFGYGPPYTQFEFSDLHTSMDAPGSLSVTFPVKNTGASEGPRLPRST